MNAGVMGLVPGIDQIMESGQASLGSLASLNRALRESGSLMQKASAGYPQQGVGYTGDFQPMIPQSIQKTLDSTSYTEQHVVFWKKLTRVDVLSTLHEAVMENSYGDMQLDPFVAEGELGSTSEAEYERKVVRVKYLSEQAQLTDVATMVGIIGASGVSRAGLAQKTLDATRALLGKLERSLFLASSDLSALHFDGLYDQITKQGQTTTAYVAGVHTIAATVDNYRDLRGASLTPQDLIDAVYSIAAAPNYGTIDTILVEPRVYAALSKYSIPFGRHDMTKDTGKIIAGEDGLFIIGNGGKIKIETAPLMLPDQKPLPGSRGSAPPAIVSGDIAVAVAADADTTNAWTADDAGNYRYVLQAVGDRGVTTVDVTTVVANALASKSTFTISDSGKPLTGDNSVRMYRLYRGPKGGTLSQATFMWQYPRAAVGTDTLIVDQNKHLPKCSQVYLIQNTPDVLYWVQLLDFLRRPIPVSKPSVVFLVMLFGTLFVKNPRRTYCLDNVATVA